MRPILITLFALLSFGAFAQTDGIKTDSVTSAQNGIEIDIVKDSTISIPHIRRCKLRNLLFTEKLEITFALEFTFYTPAGKPMSAAIDADNSLSADVKEYRKRLFQVHSIMPKTTENSVIDVMTKKVLVGQPMAGHTYVPEILLYQNMTRSDLQAMGVSGAASENRPLQLVYKMIILAMRQTLARIGLIP